MNNLIGVKDISPGPKLSIFLAVYFAELVLSIFEEKYPDDLRPRKAIEVAKTVLESGQSAAAHAADAAYAAAARAYAAAHAAARAARAARNNIDFIGLANKAIKEVRHDKNRNRK